MGNMHYSGSGNKNSRNDIDIYSGKDVGSDSRDIYSSGRTVKKKRDIKRIVLNSVFSVVLALSVLAIVAMTGFGQLAYGFDSNFKSGDDDDYNDLSFSTHEDVTYFLVVGLDYSEALTDVIMVVCFDHGKNEVNCLQIPRDTFAGSDVVKINAVYGHTGRGIKGINALRRRITSMFGLPIDHFVAINLEAFREIVDAVGGVTITLDKAMKVEASTNPDNKWGTERFTIGPGTVKLNGKQAEGFVRNRSYQAMGDPGRVNSQRKFYAAFMKEVLGMSTGEALTIAKNCYNDVNTDMTINQILGYIKAAQKLDLEKINMMAVPGQGGCYYGSQDCYSVLIKQYVELANKYLLPYDDPITADQLKITDISTKNEGNWLSHVGSLSEYEAQ